MTKVKPIRLNVTGTPTAGQVAAFVDEDSMEWVDNWTGWWTGIVPGFNEPEELVTHTRAGEPISIGDHCCIKDYNIKLLESGDELRTGKNVTKLMGQCFNRTCDAELDSAFFQVLRQPTAWGSDYQYSIFASIYAITGTYWVDAIKTGSALYTSNTITGYLGLWPVSQLFNFQLDFWDIISKWEYIIEFSFTSGTTSWGSWASILW